MGTSPAYGQRKGELPSLLVNGERERGGERRKEGKREGGREGQRKGEREIRAGCNVNSPYWLIIRRELNIMWEIIDRLLGSSIWESWFLLEEE